MMIYLYSVVMCEILEPAVHNSELKGSGNSGWAFEIRIEGGTDYFIICYLE
jgi:hypothetical protein